MEELRIITYMCPSHPVQLYELIMELLETEVGCQASLLYESRVPGPFSNRPDPFENNKVDLAFMSVSAYISLRGMNNKAIELLPVTPIFKHKLNIDSTPGYFADVIVHSDKQKQNVDSLMGLRGCSFAYSSEDSLSSSKLVLKTLRENGENASFFGSCLRSGSHLASAQMVLNKQAEWAVVDSTTLLYTKKYMQDSGRDITILETLAKLPAYPIVIRTQLPGDLKRKITEILLTKPQTDVWRNRFAKYGVIKFDTNNNAAYNGAITQVWSEKGTDYNVRYY